MKDDFLGRLFDFTDYNPATSLDLLESNGGISSLLNNICLPYRRGQDAQRLPPSQRLPPQRLRNATYFQSNFYACILYLFTLSLAVKLLINQHGGTPYFDSACADDLFGILATAILALLEMRDLKKDAGSTELSGSKGESSYNAKREGEEVRVYGEPSVGEILVFREKDVIQCDGILLQTSQLVVDEQCSVSARGRVKKEEIWMRDISTSLDPFVLSGSRVVMGYAEVLVCQVGPCTSLAKKIKMSGEAVRAKSTLMEMHFKKVSFWMCFWLMCPILALILIEKNQQEQRLIWLVKGVCNFLLYFKLAFFGRFTHQMWLNEQLNVDSPYYILRDALAFKQILACDILVIEHKLLSKSSRGMTSLRQLSLLRRVVNIKIVLEDQSDRQVYPDHPQKAFQETIDIPNSLRLPELLNALFVIEVDNTLWTKTIPSLASFGQQVHYVGSPCLPLENVSVIQPSNVPKEQSSAVKLRSSQEVESSLLDLFCHSRSLHELQMKGYSLILTNFLYLLLLQLLSWGGCLLGSHDILLLIFACLFIEERIVGYYYNQQEDMRGLDPLDFVESELNRSDIVAHNLVMFTYMLFLIGSFPDSGSGSRPTKIAMSFLANSLFSMLVEFERSQRKLTLLFSVVFILWCGGVAGVNTFLEQQFLFREGLAVSILPLLHLSRFILI